MNHQVALRLSPAARVPKVSGSGEKPKPRDHCLVSDGPNSTPCRNNSDDPISIPTGFRSELKLDVEPGSAGKPVPRPAQVGLRYSCSDPGCAAPAGIFALPCAGQLKFTNVARDPGTLISSCVSRTPE